jgi:hypothetical protein
MSAETAMQDRPQIIRDARGKRPAFYETPGMDHAMSMIMVLANEMSVLRDRLDSAERVAKANGMDLAAGIEALELDQQALEERETRRQDFLGRLFYMMRKEAGEAAKDESAASYNATIEEIAQP